MKAINDQNKKVIRYDPVMLDNMKIHPGDYNPVELRELIKQSTTVKERNKK